MGDQKQLTSRTKATVPATGPTAPTRGQAHPETQECEFFIQSVKDSLKTKC